MRPEDNYVENMFCTDETGKFIGTITVKKGIIGQGINKIITGHVLYFAFPQDAHEIYLGAIGTPVEATPKTTSQTMLKRFKQEEDIWDTLSQGVIETPQGGRNPLIGRRDNPPHETKYILRQNGIAFPQTLTDVVKIIATTPEDILPQPEKRLLLLCYLLDHAKDVNALHDMRINGNPIIHGDIGQYLHAGNLLSSARDGRSYLVDLSELAVAIPATQAEERRIFTNTMIQNLKSSGAINFLSSGLQGLIINNELHPDLLEELLQANFNEALQQVADSNNTPIQKVISLAQKNYFLAYLNWRIRHDTNNDRSRDELTSIAENIQDFIENAPTIELPSV